MSKRALRLALGALMMAAPAMPHNVYEIRNTTAPIPAKQMRLKDPKPGRLWKHGKNRRGSGHRGGRGR